jgi:hypothetical protein
MRDSLSPVNIASAMFPGASQPAPTHLPLRLPWYPHSVTPSAETVFKPPTAQHQQWWWQRLIGRAQPHIPVQITYSPQPRWWPARLQLKSAYQPLSSSPSSTWLYNRPTTREIVVSATVVFIVSVAVVVLLGLFVLPGPSSSTTYFQTVRLCRPSSMRNLSQCGLGDTALCHAASERHGRSR